MGCETYFLADDQTLSISEGQDDLACLCTFPYNDRVGSLRPRLSLDRIRSLAYLGAALVLTSRDELEHGFLPAALPAWIRQGIDQAVMDCLRFQTLAKTRACEPELVDSAMEVAYDVDDHRRVVDGLGREFVSDYPAAHTSLFDQE